MRGHKTHRRALPVVLASVLTLVAAPSAHAWGGSGWGWSPRGYEDSRSNSRQQSQQSQHSQATAQAVTPATPQPSQAAAPQATSTPAATTPAPAAKTTAAAAPKASKSCVALPKLTEGKGSGLTGYIADGKCAADGVVTLKTSGGKEIAKISVAGGDPFRFSLAPGTYRLSVRVSGVGTDDCGGPVKVTKGHVVSVACKV